MPPSGLIYDGGSDQGGMIMRTDDRARDLDLARLVQCAAGGDRQAWGGLVDHYERLITAITSESKLEEIVPLRSPR